MQVPTHARESSSARLMSRLSPIACCFVLLCNVVACGPTAEEQLRRGMKSEGGWLYVCGEYIPPPLHFRTRADTWFVNDVPLMPRAIFNPDPLAIPSPVPLEPSRHTDVVRRAEAARSQYSDKLAGWQAAAEVFAGDTLVAHVNLDSTMLTVTWVDSTRLAFGTRQLVGRRTYPWWRRGPLRPKPPTVAERKLIYVKSMIASFQRGRAVFVACDGGLVTMAPPPGLGAALKEYMAGPTTSDSTLKRLEVPAIVIADLREARTRRLQR